MFNPELVWCMFIASIVLMVILMGLIVAVIISNNKHRKRLEEITVYQINTSATIDSSIPEILHLIIKESFDDYMVKTLLPLNEGVINSAREEEIRTNLVAMVAGRLSNATLDKLSLYYNRSNIANILADKIYITVMNYVVEHNIKVNHLDGQT